MSTHPVLLEYESYNMNSICQTNQNELVFKFDNSASFGADNETDFKSVCDPIQSQFMGKRKFIDNLKQNLKTNCSDLSKHKSDDYRELQSNYNNPKKTESSMFKDSRTKKIKKRLDFKSQMIIENQNSDDHRFDSDYEESEEYRSSDIDESSVRAEKGDEIDNSFNLSENEEFETEKG